MSLASVVVVCSFLALSGGRSSPGTVLWTQDSQAQISTGTSSPSTTPAQDTAPQVHPSEPAQEPAAKPAEPPASPQEAPPEKTAAPAQTDKTPARTRKTTKKTAKKKPATKPKSTNAASKPKPNDVPPDYDAPSKTVVKNGSTTDPKVQIAPSMSPQQASDQRQGTNDLLASTDENLKKISGKSLPSDQQDMVQQIKKFMEQSKQATSAGDLERAHNLALKASLLAEELAKP